MKEVAEKLKMKSIDAAARWCIGNNIEMMTLGNKRVVSEFDFRISFEKPITEMLKRKYGDEWLVYYDVYKNEDVIKFYDLEKPNDFKNQKPIVFNQDIFLKDIGYGKS